MPHSWTSSLMVLFVLPVTTLANSGILFPLILLDLLTFLIILVSPQHAVNSVLKGNSIPLCVLSLSLTYCAVSSSPVHVSVALHTELQTYLNIYWLNKQLSPRFSALFFCAVSLVKRNVTCLTVTASQISSPTTQAHSIHITF